MPRRGTPLVLVVLAGALVSLVGAGKASPRARMLHAPHARAAPSKGPLPSVMTDVESGAEDIVDYALSGNRPSAISAAAEVRATVDGTASTALAASGVPSRTVHELEARARRLERIARNGPFVQIALAANAISQLMPGLYGHFRNPVPSQVLALDYFDREAQLRSLAHQPVRVTAAIDGLRATWPRVRPKVRGAGGEKEASAFDRHVRTMAGLRSSAEKKVQAEAIRGLELVDELERVFTG